MSYLWAGYGLTWAALVLYAWRLERRRRDAERELSLQREALRNGASGDDRPGPR